MNSPLTPISESSFYGQENLGKQFGRPWNIHGDGMLASTLRCHEAWLGNFRTKWASIHGKIMELNGEIASWRITNCRHNHWWSAQKNQVGGTGYHRSVSRQRVRLGCWKWSQRDELGCHHVEKSRRFDPIEHCSNPVMCNYGTSQRTIHRQM